MVVDRILHDRAHHRVVGAERREALPTVDAKVPSATRAPSRRPRDQELVHVRVRMAAVDEAFSRVAGSQLAWVSSGLRGRVWRARRRVGARGPGVEHDDGCTTRSSLR